MARRCIEPANGPLHGDFRAVPSKSVTHRALVAAALASGASEIRNPLEAADTRRTLDGLRALGIRVDERPGAWTVRGAGGAVPGGGSIELGASGSSARFLTALAALGAAPSTLDGDARLRERPMDELIAALRRVGASVESAPGDRLPLRAGGGPVRGGSVEVSGRRSSQFASALLLVGCAFEDGLILDIPPPRVSFPYVSLTVEILEAFGARIERPSESRFIVPRQRLQAAAIEVEGDHSSASYLWAAIAIRGGRVRLRGLRKASAQPDARLLQDLAALGCVVEDDGEGVTVAANGTLRPFAWDLADAPDLAPTAAVLALFSGGRCRLTGLDHLRLKESDRLAVIARNIERLGAGVTVDGASLTIEAPERDALRGATIEVAADHRIAMAFGVAGLAIDGVAVDDDAVVAKSYPSFWDDLGRLIRTGSSARG